MLFGVISGVFAAFFQNLGYIFVRGYVRAGRTPGALLVHSQILLGAASLVLLGPLLPLLSGWPAGWNFLLPLGLVVIGSGGGQYFFFSAERQMEPSRISALMGLRVVVVALVSELFFDTRLGGGQWIAVALAALAAPALNWEGGKFRTGGLKCFGLALAFYCLSDLSVQHMVRGFGFRSMFLGALWSVLMVNLLSGVLLLPWGRGTLRAFAPASPFAATWLLKQFLLYLCYALIGPVHGNVVLALRGVLAILMALTMCRLHLRAAEPPAGVRVWLQRAAATLLLTGAIILYTLDA